jgi:hypothetical protein
LSVNPLGDNLLPYLVLAFGGAMAVGTAMALFRPPADGAQKPDTEIDRSTLMRSWLFIVVGAVAAIWAAASLLTK